VVSFEDWLESLDPRVRRLVPFVALIVAILFAWLGPTR
jgi:hypothetical protein